MSPQQIQSAPDDDPQGRSPAEADVAALPSGERLSLAEMTRIMDVATTLRKERALVEQQLNIDQIKAELRERLMAAARVSGDTVSEAEVDAAVEQYYDRMHEFAEPPRSWRTVAAHLYVRRGPIVKIAAAVAVAAALLWGMFFAGLLPGKRRDAMQIDKKLSAVEVAVTQINDIAKEPTAQVDAAELLAAAKTAAASGDLKAVEQVLGEVGALSALLMQDYTLSIYAPPGQRTVTERQWKDQQGERVSGYYVSVRATDAQGNPVSVTVRDRESGETAQLSVWVEQIPQAVFERLLADKEADGVLDELTFGVKRRGERSLEVQMPGADGKPIERAGQLASWDDKWE